MFAVADPGFPRGRGANPPRGGDANIRFAKISEKLHNVEKNLYPEGGGRASEILLSTTALFGFDLVSFYFVHFY